MIKISKFFTLPGLPILIMTHLSYGYRNKCRCEVISRKMRSRIKMFNLSKDYCLPLLSRYYIESYVSNAQIASWIQPFV